MTSPSKQSLRSRPLAYMAVDQYGHTYHGLTRPRRDLLQRLGKTKAEKMYRDRSNAPPIHIGYVIGGLWLTLYEVRPWEKPA